MGRLGIVTVTRNDRAGLEATLESVLGQDRPPAELLVVDGASTDGTLDVLKRPGRPDWFRYRSEPDAGIYDAMNWGAQHVGGDLILFLNSGDVFKSRHTVADLEESERAHRWQWAYGDAELLGYEGRPGISLHQLKVLRWLRFRTGTQTVPHQATVMRHDLFAQLGGFDLGAGVSADQELLLRAWLRHRPYYLDRVIAVCDGGGVGSTQPVATLAHQMARHRRRNGAAFRPGVVDRGVEALSAIYSHLNTRTDRLIDAANRLRST